MMKYTIAALMVAASQACYSDWIWEECSWSWYRNDCTGTEVYGDNGDGCGWIYWDDWLWEEYEVTCNEEADWWWCD